MKATYAEADLRPRIASIGARTQLAALPWRQADGQIELMMITSRLSGHWLIPKGWPMKGKTDAQAAAREAYEEAGVKGIVSTGSIGGYEYEKLLLDGTATRCRVDVYALQVERELEKWPELGERRRRWMTAREAAGAVFEAGLANFLASVDPKLIVGSINHRSRHRR